jgi:hypothetical protein
LSHAPFFPDASNPKTERFFDADRDGL